MLAAPGIEPRPVANLKLQSYFKRKSKKCLSKNEIYPSSPLFFFGISHYFFISSSQKELCKAQSCLFSSYFVSVLFSLFYPESDFFQIVFNIFLCCPVLCFCISAFLLFWHNCTFLHVKIRQSERQIKKRLLHLMLLL